MAQKGRILVVDHEREVRKTLYLLLTREGYEVFLAEEGSEALNKMKVEPFDLLIIDRNMPLPDGVALAEKVRGWEPDIPLILMTDYPEEECAVRSREPCVCDHLQKPVKKDQVLRIVKSALEKRQKTVPQPVVACPPPVKEIPTLVHELNNSLTGILLVCQRLMDTCPPEIKKEVEKISKEMNRTSRLIDELRTQMRFARSRILIVDDEEMLLDALGEALTPLGYSVEKALTAKDAIRKMGMGSFDVIILDIKMPEMDGQELYQWATENVPDLARRIVFTTGDLLSGSTHDFIHGGGHTCLAKPFGIQEIARVIHEKMMGIGEEETCFPFKG